MNKRKKKSATTADATSITGLHVLSFVLHRLAQWGQSRSVLALILLSLSLLLRAQTVLPAKPFSFADLQYLQSVGDVQMSPDGHAIVYSVSAVDIQHDRVDRTFWMVRLTNTSVPVGLPPNSGAFWSPDGQTLAIVNESSGRSTVRLLRAGTLEVFQNFTVPSSPGRLVWSPDGKSFAFTLFVPDEDAPSFLQQAVDTAEGDLDKPAGAQWAAPVQITQSVHYRSDGGEWLPSPKGHRHLFVLSTVNGVMRQVGSEPFDDGDPAWFPDSKRLIFTSDRRPGNEHMLPIPAIYMTDMSGHATKLTRGNDSFSTPEPSPDGKWITYIRTPFRLANYTTNELCIMRPDGSEARQLAPDLDRDLSDITWAANAQGVYAKFADHGISHIGLFDLEGHRKTLASGVGGQFSISRTGMIAYSGESSDGPNELILQDLGKSIKTITSLNQFLKQRQLGSLMHLNARSGADGTPVEGWAVLPPGSTRQHKLPMILTLHGGPFGDEGPYWSSEYQLFAAAGYVVVYVNYRGSTSYGSAFSEPANRDFPGVA